MATPTKATGTAPDSDVVTERSVAEIVADRKYDPRKMVYVYNTETGAKLAHPVPETWLDGRFPQLTLTPSKKAGK